MGPLGPRARGRERGSGSPRVLVPQPQAPQAVLARLGPPLLACSLWAGMQAHTSRRSRERGLGQTQSLRSRSNVTSAYNPSSRGSELFCPPWVTIHVAHSHADTHINKNKSKRKNLLSLSLKLKLGKRRGFLTTYRAPSPRTV